MIHKDYLVAVPNMTCYNDPSKYWYLLASVVERQLSELWNIDSELWLNRPLSFLGTIQRHHRGVAGLVKYCESPNSLPEAETHSVVGIAVESGDVFRHIVDPGHAKGSFPVIFSAYPEVDLLAQIGFQKITGYPVELDYDIARRTLGVAYVTWDKGPMELVALHGNTSLPDPDSNFRACCIYEGWDLVFGKQHQANSCKNMFLDENDVATRWLRVSDLITPYFAGGDLSVLHGKLDPSHPAWNFVFVVIKRYTELLVRRSTSGENPKSVIELTNLLDSIMDMIPYPSRIIATPFQNLRKNILFFGMDSVGNRRRDLVDQVTEARDYVPHREGFYYRMTHEIENVVASEENDQ